MARSWAQCQAWPLHKPQGPQGSEHLALLPIHRLPTCPPARPPVPRMGPPSGCRTLTWALLALLLVQKAGKVEPSLTVTAQAASAGPSPGAFPAENGQAGPHPVCPGDAGSPRETAKRVLASGIGGVSTSEGAESGALPAPREAPIRVGKDSHEHRPLHDGAPSFCPRGSPTAAWRSLLDTGLPRGEEAASGQEPHLSPPTTPAAQPSSAASPCLSVCLLSLRPEAPWSPASREQQDS